MLEVTRFCHLSFIFVLASHLVCFELLQFGAHGLLPWVCSEGYCTQPSACKAGTLSHFPDRYCPSFVVRFGAVYSVWDLLYCGSRVTLVVLVGPNIVTGLNWGQLHTRQKSYPCFISPVPRLHTCVCVCVIWRDLRAVHRGIACCLCSIRDQIQCLRPGVSTPTLSHSFRLQTSKFTFLWIFPILNAAVKGIYKLECFSQSNFWKLTCTFFLYLAWGI